MSRVWGSGCSIPVHIYGLCDPITGEVRYVGRSAHLALRLKTHMGRCAPNRVKEWIEELGRPPVVAILETVQPGGNPDAREQVWMARFYRHRLLNERGFPRTGAAIDPCAVAKGDAA